LTKLIKVLPQLYPITGSCGFNNPSLAVRTPIEQQALKKAVFIDTNGSEIVLEFSNTE